MKRTCTCTRLDFHESIHEQQCLMKRCSCPLADRLAVFGIINSDFFIRMTRKIKYNLQYDEEQVDVLG